tara:strand:+ start:479 stop:592 length:114 start_codon:yes stop_codon:yes gene_type:complete
MKEVIGLSEEICLEDLNLRDLGDNYVVSTGILTSARE